MGKELENNQLQHNGENNFTDEERKLLDDLKGMYKNSPKSTIAKAVVNSLSDKPIFIQTSISIIKIRSSLIEFFKKQSVVCLNSKVGSYITWYKGQKLSSETWCTISELRNFIEKMAVWYELRCPSEKLNNIDDTAFNEYYNFEGFFATLSKKEKELVRKTIYRGIIYMDTFTHFHLSQDGLVSDAEGIGSYTNYKIRNEELENKHISEVFLLFKERGITLPNDNELACEVIRTEQLEEIRRKMLECVMYRIIERGGKIIGPRRALLFAQEFGTDIDIPMMYGVDYTDKNLKDFIDAYLNAGGHDDLECYVGYLSRIHRYQRFNKISIKELLEKLNDMNGVQKTYK